MSEEQTGDSTKTKKLAWIDRTIRFWAPIMVLLYLIIHTTLGLTFGLVSEVTMTTIVVIGGIYGLIAAGVAFYVIRLPPKIAILPRDRIAEAREHMDATGKILRELEDELTTRIKVLEQLQTDSERYEQLASLNRSQAKAIEDMVGHQFKRQARITWWQWWGAIVLAGILGFIINWASSPLWEWITR